MSSAEDPLRGIPKSGETLAGKYEIRRVLGQGGMGVVLEAMHLDLEERVAIKFLYASALENQEAVSRFLREARLAVKIKSEHVCKVLDVSRDPSGAPYLVMEYLEGTDLATLIEKYGSLSTAEAVEYVLQACEAIAEAHALGIVHRDLKPENLFVARRADGTPCVKVLDFGISKVMPQGSPMSGMTNTQSLMGTPLYMSPEQMASAKNVDPRTDIWALGAIFFELLVGRPPFVAQTMPEMCTKVLQEPTPHASVLKEGLNPRVDRVILRALEKDPAKRYSTIAELAGALAELGPERLRTSLERITRVMSGVSHPVIDNPTTDIAGARTVAPWSTASTQRASKKHVAIGVGASLAVGCIVAAILFARGSGAPATAPADTAPSPAIEPASRATAGALVAPPNIAVTSTPTLASATPTATEAPSALPSTQATAKAPKNMTKPSTPQTPKPTKASKDPFDNRE